MVEDKSTGVAEEQIRGFRNRIKLINNHLSKNKHDYVTKSSLMRIVSKYRRMLRYLKNTSTKRSSSVVIIK